MAARTKYRSPGGRVDSVGVVIPVHDEVERVQATMVAVSAAARECDLPVEVVVVLDSCADGTDAVVRRHMAGDRSLVWHIAPSSFRRASSSRGVGLELLATRSGSRPNGSNGSTAILSTDGDSEVPLDWITHHVRRLDSGVDAVAGIVDIARSAGDGICHESWHAEYTSGFRADGGHPHVHCANLAVRLDMILRAGGFGHLARAEDIDLWRRLGLVGARCLSDQASVVVTSSRSDGRVAGGFATALAQFRPPVPGVVRA